MALANVQQVAELILDGRGDLGELVDAVGHHLLAFFDTLIQLSGVIVGDMLPFCPSAKGYSRLMCWYQDCLVIRIDGFT